MLDFSIYIISSRHSSMVQHLLSPSLEKKKKKNTFAHVNYDTFVLTSMGISSGQKKNHSFFCVCDKQHSHSFSQIKST